MISGETSLPRTFSPGLFGKVPAQGDFVRINVVDPTAQEFSRWIQEGYETLHRVGNDLPKQPICFYFSSPLARNLLVGAMVPSRDQVGREFPVAVFAPVESSSVGAQFFLVPLAFGRFLSAAAALLAAAPTLGAAQLANEVNALPLPNLGDWNVADMQRKLQLQQDSGSLLNQFAESTEADGTHYAMRTFLMACESERNGAPNKARVVLDCPLAGVGPLPWLELAGRILEWGARSPSFLWTEATPARVLFALGPMPASALGYLARPELPLTVFWPLKTPHASARSAAQQALPPEQRRAIDDRGLSIDQLFSHLSGRPCR